MATVTPVPIVPGSRLRGRYRLDARIAAGAMGEVWRATDTALGRRVAVKLLRPRHAVRDEDLDRFRAEARHAASLSHPGIAQVYDYGGPEPGRPPFLVMELVDGPSLARMLDGGPLTPAYTMALVAQAAAALQAAHAAGLVHRDIKPGNLLVSRTGQVKVTDFGVARAAGSAHLTGPEALMGTPAYLAPERTAGAEATPAADLYALGIVAFQCLAGRLPFTGEPLAVALAHLEQPLPPLPPSVPAEVAALVADLTARDPRARPASAAEAAARAESLRSALSAGAARARGVHRGRLARHPLRTAGAAVTAPALAMACWALAGAVAPASPRPAASPPAATGQPGHRGSHPARGVPPVAVLPVAVSAIPRPAGARGGAGRPAISQESSAPGGTLTGTSAPAPRPTSAGTPAPTATPTPRGTPTAGGTPAPTGTPTGSGTPTPAGTAPSGTPKASETSTSTGTPAGTPTSSGTTAPGGPPSGGSPATSGTSAASGPTVPG